MKNYNQLHTDSKTGTLPPPVWHSRQLKTSEKSKKALHKYRVNHKHKDCLFRLVFNNKKDLLELYNAVNDTNYTNVNDLSVYTLEDAIYISYKNDISFLFGEMLNLYEHQSTLNPNMPVRGLIYLAKNIEAYIELAHLDIYSSVLQKLPLPQYIVFYNGTDHAPERMSMKLSDAFPVIKGKVPCLECTATLLNINYGHNRTVMKRCQKLYEYACFISCIRENQKAGLTLDAAIDKAISDCIRAHILESVLIKQRAEVMHVVLSTFDQENHDRILKEAHEKIGEKRGFTAGKKRGFTDGRKRGFADGKKRGFADGQKHGLAIGKNALLKSQIAKKLAKNKSIEQICEELEETPDTVLKIIREMHPTSD